MHIKKPPWRWAAGSKALQTATLHQTLGRCVVVVLDTVFVANHLTIQLVYQVIDRCIQIFVGAFSEHIAALDMDVAFSALTSLLFLLVLHR